MANEITEYVISSIATSSLKEILKTQATDDKTIWALTADSVIDKISFRGDLSEPMLGIKVYKGDKVRFSMPYCHEKKNKITGLQHNKISVIEKERISALLKFLNIEDVPISDLTLLIESPELTEVLRKHCGCNQIKSNEKFYIAKFVSEKCDGDQDIKKFMKFEVNDNLVKHHKFKHFILNLTYLIDLRQHTAIPLSRRQPIHDARKQRYFDLPIKGSEYRLAKTLKDIYGEYGVTKHFKKNREDRLVLIGVE